MQVLQQAPLTSLASIRSISGWEEFLDDGNKYLHTAFAAHANRQEIFTPEILYNIIAMAIEKFVMAALMRHGTMPYNHTVADLVEAMEQVFPESMADIKEGLLNLDKYQDICDPYEFTITPPDINDIPSMLILAGRLQEMVVEELV